MKCKTIITIILFIFSILLIKSGSYFIRENDDLMKLIKKSEKKYYIKPIDAIITKSTMIPGVSGRKVNLIKSYKKMKIINDFEESLLVFDIIKPSKSISNVYNKVIVSGNPTVNKISILLNNNDNYCFTTDLKIDNDCQNKYTIYVKKISTNHLTKIKEYTRNGAIFFLESVKETELNLIYKYLKNNNYIIVKLDELIKE